MPAAKIGHRWRKWLETRKLPEGKIARPGQRGRDKAVARPAGKSAREHEKEAIIVRKRRQLKIEMVRLDRQERRLASRQRRHDEAAQWQFEKEMEDYVLGRSRRSKRTP